MNKQIRKLSRLMTEKLTFPDGFGWNRRNEQALWALSMWIEITQEMGLSNVARRNPSTGTRMSLPAMVQALSRAHLFTIFIKSSP